MLTQSTDKSVLLKNINNLDNRLHRLFNQYCLLKGLIEDGGDVVETDPVFTASPAFGITEANKTAWNGAVTNSHTHSNKTVLDGILQTQVDNWNAAATATTNGSFVPSSGNTSIGGQKTFSAFALFSGGLRSGSIDISTNGLNFTTTGGNLQTIARFHNNSTGGLHLQAPGVAPAANANQLTVDGTTLLNGLTTTQDIVPNANGSNNIGSNLNNYLTVNALNVLSNSSAVYGSRATNASISFWQGNTSQRVLGYHPSGGGGYVQAPGVAPAVNGYMWSVYGDQLIQGKQRVTGDITQANTGSFYSYNTTDETTNYERLKLGFEGNFATIKTEQAGTGLLRNLQIYGNTYHTNSNITVVGRVFANSGIQGSSSGALTPTNNLRLYGINVQPDANALSSGIATPLRILQTYVQTGTAGSTDIFVDRTETSLGSGTHNFADFQVAGVSRYRISNTGYTFVSAGATFAGSVQSGGNFETSGNGSGYILKSPNGTRYRLTVDNAGALTVTPFP